jgi:hypothetical protein
MTKVLRALVLFILLASGMIVFSQKINQLDATDAIRLFLLGQGLSPGGEIRFGALPDELKPYTFPLSENARIIASRSVYFHLGASLVEVYVELSNPNNDTTAFSNYVRLLYVNGWRFYSTSDNAGNSLHSYVLGCVADKKSNQVLDGVVIEPINQGSSMDGFSEGPYRTWLRFSKRTAAGPPYPDYSPPSPCYGDITVAPEPDRAPSELPVGQTLCDFFVGENGFPYEVFGLTINTPSPAQAISYKDGTCSWSARKTTIYGKTLPMTMTVVMNLNDTKLADEVWSKVMHYRCESSEGVLIPVDLADSACWQDQADYAMSGGFKVLYVHHEDAIYLFAINSDFYHLKLN